LKNEGSGEELHKDQRKKRKERNHEHVDDSDFFLTQHGVMGITRNMWKHRDGICYTINVL
jgi:hypothetical protein